MSQRTHSAVKNTGRDRKIRILIIAAAVILFVFFIRPAIMLRAGEKDTPDPTRSAPFVLGRGNVYRQEIVSPPQAFLTALNVCFGTYSRTNNGVIRVRLYEDDAEIASWSMPANELADNAYQRFELEAPWTVKPDSAYAFTVSEQYKGRNAVALWTSGSDPEGYTIDGEPRDGRICFTTSYRLFNPRTTELTIAAVIAMAALALAAILIYSHRSGLSRGVGTLAERCADVFRPRSDRITPVDWIIFGAITVFCFLTMQHSDILHTGSSSFALLRGHILDFYEYNAKYLGGNSYMISTYIIFALWNIPLAILGRMGPPSMEQSFGVLMWFKLLPTTLFVISGILFYKICRKFEDRTGVSAKWGTFLFLLTPTAFYSQFMFGQYDSLTVVFLLLAIKVLLDEKENSLTWFSVLFGIATTFKYHALLFFVPILVYREKRIPKLIKYAICYGIPVLLVNILYLHSPAFTSGVEGFHAINYIFSPSIPYLYGGNFVTYLVPVLWVILCVYAYSRATASDAYDRLRDMAYLTNLVVWLAFGVIFWHPQWLMIATPFLALSIVVCKRRSVICMLDALFMFAFISFVEFMVFWPNMTLGFYDLGILKDAIAGHSALAHFNSLGRFCLVKDYNLAYTIMSCVLMARALLVRPEWDAAPNLSTPAADARWFRLRSFVGICAMVVPMAIILVSMLHAPKFIANTDVSLTRGSVSIEVETDGDFKDFSAAVWSEKNGTDDIIWYPLTQSEDSLWTCEVDLANYSDTGNYIVEYYSFPEGEAKPLTRSGFEVTELPGAKQDS